MMIMYAVWVYLQKTISAGLAKNFSESLQVIDMQSYFCFFFTHAGQSIL